MIPQSFLIAECFDTLKRTANFAGEMSSEIML